MICAGIDAGSRTIKIVLIDGKTRAIIAKGITDQGVEQEKLSLGLFEKLLGENNISKDQVRRIVATGYGRNIISYADTTITEITCHAVGVHHLVPQAMTIIDIGGQDSKLLRLDRNGKVRDFAMNDRCAGGTGRFLEVVAERLEVDIDDLGATAAKSTAPAVISSMCVVFAETEIVGLLATGKKREDIVAGVQRAIAERVVTMAGRNVDLPIVFTGGVAMISGMDTALRSALRNEIIVSPQPQITGAMGAAILASSGTG